MSLYDEVLTLAKSSLGPAAERFVSRQLSALELEKDLLGPQHLESLSQRCYTSAKLLMDEGEARKFAEVVKDMNEELVQLGPNPYKESS